MENDRFSYLASAIAKYCADDMLVEQYRIPALAKLGASELEELRAVCDEIEKREDIFELSVWAAKGHRTDTPEIDGRKILLLFAVLDGLADLGIEPFASRRLRLL